jgi:hypothetical protein
VGFSEKSLESHGEEGEWLVPGAGEGMESECLMRTEFLFGRGKRVQNAWTVVNDGQCTRKWLR